MSAQTAKRDLVALAQWVCLHAAPIDEGARFRPEIPHDEVPRHTDGYLSVARGDAAVVDEHVIAFTAAHRDAVHERHDNFMLIFKVENQGSHGTNAIPTDR